MIVSSKRTNQKGDGTRWSFDNLTTDGMVAAVCRLADDGFSDHDIAGTTKLSVEMVRQILGQRALS